MFPKAIFLLILVAFLPHLNSVSHWVLQNNVIYKNERSQFNLKDFGNLHKILEQEELVRSADKLLSRLDSVKKNIVDDAPLLNLYDSIGDKDCLESGLLADFDFSILPAIGKMYNGSSIFEQYMCEAAVPKDVPDCSQTPQTFSMGDYQHIKSVPYIKDTKGNPVFALVSYIPIDDLALYGHCLHKHLQQNQTNWHVYFGASFYWRLRGNDVAASECIFRSLHYAGTDVELRDGPLVTLANLLSNAGFDADAALVMEHSADSPYLQQLKLWSAGNLYTLAEQYKLSLTLYNKVTALGPFPLATERLKTMDCYSSVIQRMEKQNNVLRETLKKLQMRHELETDYIGVQEKVFSNLDNTTLPDHIVQHIRNTEEAVINTHNLVIEQQEIQNTLSPTKFQFPVETRSDDEIMEKMVGDLEELLQSKLKKQQKKTEPTKKDISWIRDTRKKLEELVRQIKQQLSDPEEVPIIYENVEDEEEKKEEGGEGKPEPQSEEKGRTGVREMTEERKEERESRVQKKANEEANAEANEEANKETSDEVVPLVELDVPELEFRTEMIKGERQQFLVGKYYEYAKDHRTSREPETAMTDGDDDEEEVVEEFILTTDAEVFPPRDEEGSQNGMIEKLDQDGDCLKTGRCRLPKEIQGSLRREVHAILGDKDLSGATFELVSKSGSSVGMLPSEVLESEARRLLESDRAVASDRPALEEGALLALIERNLNSTSLDLDLERARLEVVPAPAGDVNEPVEVFLGEETWTLRFYKVPVSKMRVVRVEQCQKYVPIFSHPDPYIPISPSIISYNRELRLMLNPHPSTHYALSPDCTRYMRLDNCFRCYDHLPGANLEEYDTRHILEDFTRFELSMVTGYVELLGAALDSALRKGPDNWLLYYVAALYHRSFTFELGPAVQCTRRALALAPLPDRSGPLLTLSNLLFQARNIPSATTVALELLQTDPNQFLHRVQASALQIAVGRPAGQFLSALEASYLSRTSPITDHLLSSLLCYYNIHKGAHEPPHKKQVQKGKVSYRKLHPPFTKAHKKLLDGDLWRIEHRSGTYVDVTWVTD